MPEIPLRSVKYPGLFATVDDADYEWALQYGWCPSMQKGRLVSVVATINYKHVQLHREVLKRMGHDMDSKLGDHWDGDPLNNRRDNLRPCEPRQNTKNRRQLASKGEGSMSRFKGVHWDKARKLWCAEIKVDYKKIHLGRFYSELEAAIAYNRAAEKYHGEFASLNEIPEEPIVYVRSPRTTTSLYRGVYYSQERDKWTAEIRANGKRHRLGRFDTELEAARAYDKAARDFLGEAAKLNFEEE